MLTEGNGVPIGLALDAANRNDFKMTNETLQSIPIDRPAPTKQGQQNLCMDKGYDYDEVRALVREFGFTAHICSRGEEAKLIRKRAGFKARRWVVERAHGWFNRYRGILIRWSKKAANHIAMLHLACGLISWKATGLLR